MTFLKRLLLAIVALATLLTPALAQPGTQTITGIVTNKTTGKPAANDDVVLLKLAQGMQELSRTKSDARGRFTLKVPDEGPDALHMVRVTHDKANYFRPVQAGTQSVEVEVYSAAPEVDGITLTEDVMQVQTEPGNASLRVVEHFLLKNESSPAKTLFSDHPFELNLPPGAVVDGGAAKGPGAQSMAVQASLVPFGAPDHYTIIFPIRPGDTEFHVWYHLPYKDSFTFHPRPVMRTLNLAVMMPRSMTFKTASPSPFAAVTEDIGAAQAFLARDAQPSQPLEFTVSGTGQLPRESGGAQAGGGAQASGGAQAGGGASSAASAAAGGDPNADTRPGGGLGTPVDKDAQREPESKYKWWIIAGFALAFATAAGFMLRSPGAAPPAAIAAAAAPNTPDAPPSRGALQVLRDEMFSLETDRLAGRLSEAQYHELKSAYDVVLRRALERSGHASAAVPAGTLAAETVHTGPQ